MVDEDEDVCDYWDRVCMSGLGLLPSDYLDLYPRDVDLLLDHHKEKAESQLARHIELLNTTIAVNGGKKFFTREDWVVKKPSKPRTQDEFGFDQQQYWELYKQSVGDQVESSIDD